MSVFVLKCIAVASMITDHLAYILSLAGYAHGQTVLIMRSVGRVAFPVFAFLLVNGLDKTRDRVAYFSRLALFALISQLPFSLAFSPENYSAAALLGGDLVLRLAPHWLQALPVILFVALIYYYFLHRQGRVGLFTVQAALILPLLRLNMGELVLLGDEFNVFFTLAVSLALVSALDALISGNERRSSMELALLMSAAVAAALYILPKSDYNYKGLLLIFALYLARNSRLAQIIVSAAWCVYLYGFNPYFLVGGLCACVLILLYNHKKGPAFKFGFYLVYPMHLLSLYVLVFLYNYFH